MKPLLKLILTIGVCFALTFVALKLSGFFSVAQVEGWLEHLSSISPVYLAAAIGLVLFADLFIAVPTLTVTILAGALLGFPLGALTALGGMGASALCGYTLSTRFGERILRLVLRDAGKINEAKDTFRRNGFLMIVLARAVPILPEVTICIAGLTRMPKLLFLSAWSLGSIPYVLVATYAGSVSSLDDPRPAIFAAIALSGTLWFAWLIVHRHNRLSASS